MKNTKDITTEGKILHALRDANYSYRSLQSKIKEKNKLEFQYFFSLYVKISHYFY